MKKSEIIVHRNSENPTEITAPELTEILKPVLHLADLVEEELAEVLKTNDYFCLILTVRPIKRAENEIKLSCYVSVEFCWQKMSIAESLRVLGIHSGWVPLQLALCPNIFLQPNCTEESLKLDAEKAAKELLQILEYNEVYQGLFTTTH